MKIYKIFTIILFLSISLHAKDIIFGVVPQQSTSKLIEAWQPLMDYLSRTTGHKIIFRTEKSIAMFLKVLESGNYDMAYSSPYHYVVADKKHGYDALVRFNELITGILVVKKDSNITSVEDIKTKSFLFPSPRAFAATLLPKYEFLAAYNYSIDEFNNLRYVNSHDSVYKGIIRNYGDIGGGIMRTYLRFESKDELRIIYKTKDYPSHIISINSSLDSNVKTTIEEALLNMPQKYTHNISDKKLIATSDIEYQDIEKLITVCNKSLKNISKTSLNKLNLVKEKEYHNISGLVKLCDKAVRPRN